MPRYTVDKRMQIPLKSDAEIWRIREAGRVVAAVLKALADMIAPGVTTADMCRHAEEVMRAWGGLPVFPSEAGFPAAICTSINEEVVHGVPGLVRLKEGDIVSVDVGVRLDGYIADAAWTFPVGQVSDVAGRLLEAGRAALDACVARCRAGGSLDDIGGSIQETASRYGYSVVRDFVGHGVGRRLHEPPQVPNYSPVGPELAAVVLEKGLVLALEPMLNTGTYRLRWLPNGWTVVTADAGLSCHFEHTVAVGAGAGEVLTVP